MNNDQNLNDNVVAFKSRKKRSIKKRTGIIIVSAVALAMLSLVVYFVVTSISADKNRQYVLEINYDLNDTTSYAAIDDKIVSLGTEGLTVYARDGLVLQSVEKHMANPVLVTSKKLALAYDGGGKLLLVADANSVKFEHTFETPIMRADFASNGFLTVVTEAPNYKAVVTVFNKSFKEIFRWSSASEYVAAAEVTQDGKTLAVATYLGDNALISTAINFFSLSTAERVGRVEGLNGIAYTLSCKDKSFIHVLTSAGLYCVQDMKNLSTMYSFENEYLQFFSTYQTDTTAILLNKNIVGGVSDLIFFNKNILEKIVHVSGEIRSMKMSKNYVAVLSENEVKVFTLSGDEYTKTASDQQSKDIVVMDDGDVVVFGLSNVILVR